MRFKSLALSGLLCGAVAIPCAADVIYNFGANGPEPGEPGKFLQGSATLTFNDAFTSLTISLTNTLSQLENLGQILTNFEFDALSGVTLTLTGASAAGTATCVDGSGSSYTCSASIGSVSQADAFGWTGEVTSGEFVLSAGDGSYKPYGIANTSINNCTGSPNCDGLNNGTHIPYLIGPANFTFTVSGLTSAPTFTDVQFSFGTGPSFVPGTSSTGGGGGSTGGPLPEPGSTSLALLGMAALGASLWKRRRTTAS